MYDAIVIGGGPGGYVCAIRLSQLGKKVALVEKEYLGGTCTNWGCIPTKAMLTSAHLFSEIKDKSKRLGVDVSDLNYRLDGIMSHMNRTVTTSRKGIELLLKKNGVDFFNDKAVVKDPHNVLLEKNNSLLEAKNIVLANGSEPSMFPPFSKVEGMWTSNDVFKLAEMPSSLAIVGGGVIGVEFATFFSTFGVKTTIVELADHILPYEDTDVAEEIRKVLKKKGVTILEKTKVVSVEKLDKGYLLNTTGDEEITIEAEKVLVAVGRRAVLSDDIKNLGLEIVRGVVTDRRMKTSVQGVYAIGDIRAGIMLAHVASYEGIVAAHNIAGEELEMDYSAVPSIIFSSPEVASTGLKESDLKDRSDVVVSRFPLSANGRARTILESSGFVKVLAEHGTGRVLGMSIVSPSATDLIMEAVIAVKNGLTVEQLENSIHPHPTLSETVLGALEGIEGKSIHI
ncbi:MAG: dihydrolipoyl dehydrogenase [Thermotogaceae bacterium]|jgi:dihydrolipoamide dehydrogenase|nr:dihydrolipoyl dehydrogenase [Mesotoga sp.]MDI9375094.1 dihydrolipoyl dehydrogenase [Thermotogota bacterium]NLX33449.1 dihydrolipoyl dehydrogenase [Thermotogaceae bacterium]MDD4039484.1 dihydrolipoyl dehydrogenase [Mesotoga sp.]MDD4479443.1 dihydrolipoyl dehydrogenase [Mesotoga sp.]